MSAPLGISSQDYKVFSIYLQDVCGIVLGDNKEYLVSSRLKKIMAQQKLENLADLVEQMKLRVGLKENIVDAMTTNETLWFRDTHPFRIMHERIFPELSKKRQPLKIWSAACSSGQEPYSISMEIEEYRLRNPGSIVPGEKIMATDISTTILDRAKKAEYDALALNRGLPKDYLQRYFNKKSDTSWVIKDNIRRRVDFRSLNLLNNYHLMGKYDVILCRNVLIYFSNEVKLDILRRLHGALKPGGYLFLGASEALNGLPELYNMVHCHPGIIYQAK